MVENFVNPAGLEGLMPFKNEFRQKLRDHFSVDPSTLPIVVEEFARYNHANVFLAIEDYTKEKGRSATIMGMQGGFMDFKSKTLSELVAPGTAANMVGLGGQKEGPVMYTNVDLAGGHKLACVQQGLYLVKAQSERLAVLLRPDDLFGGISTSGNCKVEVMAPTRAEAEKFLGYLRAAIGKRSIYRGKVLSLGSPDTSYGGAFSVDFHTLPEITRQQIILPEGLLKRIERQSVDATKYREALLASKRRLKRGLLLHGPPGTGKTLTAMYLASQMKERTVLLLTGPGMGFLAHACSMARQLQPAMIVIEDVDLIGEERTKQGCSTTLLFELLNQMDGLSDDSDVLFLLTTNRPDILEPALAARPGRIDQAFEVPLPDADCRRRLFALYSDGLDVQVSDMEPFIRRTEGASAAFINELMRKAALFAAPDGVPIVVRNNHLDEALHELAVEGGSLTRSLLGFQKFGFRSSKGEEN